MIFKRPNLSDCIQRVCSIHCLAAFTGATSFRSLLSSGYTVSSLLWPFRGFYDVKRNNTNQKNKTEVIFRNSIYLVFHFALDAEFVTKMWFVSSALLCRFWWKMTKNLLLCGCSDSTPSRICLPPHSSLIKAFDWSKSACSISSSAVLGVVFFEFMLLRGSLRKILWLQIEDRPSLSVVCGCAFKVLSLQIEDWFIFKKLIFLLQSHHSCSDLLCLTDSFGVITAL